MLPALDFDPAVEPTTAIGTVAVLGDETLQPHQAGVPEQVRANLALFEWRRTRRASSLARSKPLSAPRSVRAVAVYDHHPPHCISVGFRDGEPALAHHTERDDASALASAECVAVDRGGPVRFVAKRLIIHVRRRY